MSHPATSEALRAQAIAEVTAERWTHLFHSLVPRDDSSPVGDDEALSLLPEGALVLYLGQQTYGPTSLIARLDHCTVEASIESGLVHLCVAAHSAEVARQVARAVADRVPAPRPSDSMTVELAVWAKEKTSAESRQTSLPVPTWSEVQRNYPSATRTQLARLMQHRPGESAAGGRLILLHGPPGTGKTYAIRALLSEWRDWCRPALIVDPEVALYDYGYLRKLMEPRFDERWRLVICEDADRFVRTNNRSTDNGVLDRLLNATDGLLGQSSQTLFLLTTNIELATINPALSRPGRCLAVVSFEPFNAAEARDWLGGGPFRPMTLAEMFTAKTTLIPVHSERHAYGQYL